MKQKRAHDSQIVNAKENPNLSHAGPCKRQALGINQRMNASRQGRH